MILSVCIFQSLLVLTLTVGASSEVANLTAPVVEREPVQSQLLAPETSQIALHAGGENWKQATSAVRSWAAWAKNEAPPSDKFPRIIGGEVAPPGAYPWMVAVVDAHEEDAFFAQFCAGTLIEPQWVLTAAHCVSFSTPADLNVIIGRHDLTTEEGERIAVERIIVHEDYRFYAADIALLKLQTPSTMPVIPLNQFADNPLANPGTMALILGWGARDTRKPGFPVKLHQAMVTLVSNEICQENAPFARESHICAGFPEGGKDVCFGDSGGPLAVPDGEGGWLQVGIVSLSACGRPNLFGVYTRVSSFVDWVEFPNPIYFAQFGNGEEFTSDIVVFNPSSANTTTGSITFWDSLGNQLDSDSLVTNAGQNTGSGFTLPPLAATTIFTNGMGELVVGSATVSADYPVASVIRFRIPAIGIAGVSPSEPATRLIAPVRRQGNLSTAVAIRNTSREEITVNLTLKDLSGQPVTNATTQLTISAQGRVGKFIQELFPDVDTASFQGTLIIEAESGEVVVIVLEVGSEPGEFTTLTVSPIQ